MKKLFIMILLTFLLNSCKSKVDIAKISEIKVNLNENPKLEKLIKDINRDQRHSALVLNRDKFILIYNNPSSKVKDYNLDILDGELYINLEGEEAKDEPMRFYQVGKDTEVGDYIKKYDVPKKVHIFQNGEEIQVVYFENVDIK
ncbi:MAG: hypothetical protein Q4E02_01685 [Lagierella massiliensis]|nr:hypothetical protein [Lagierella massiliensis]